MDQQKSKQVFVTLAVTLLVVGLLFVSGLLPRRSASGLAFFLGPAGAVLLIGCVASLGVLVDRLIPALARITALLGGLVLLCLVVMMTITIVGRSTGLGELTGSYEILEAGIAFAIFSFLPITQLYGGHATVDVFTSFLSPRVNRWIVVFWEIVLLLVILLIVWRLYEGTLSHFKRGGTTTFLQFPLWWPYTASCIAGSIASVTAHYSAVMRIGEAMQNRNILPSEHAEH